MKKLIAILALSCLSPPLFAATRTWTGSAGALWSDPANWNGGVPAAGDDLVFPSVTNETSTNDLPPGLMLHSITLTGDGYRISGNAIILGAGGINISNHFVASIVFDQMTFSSITLAVSQTWTSTEGSESVLVGPTDVNGNTLTLNDGGAVGFQTLVGGSLVVKNGDGNVAASNSTFGGAVIVNSGQFLFQNAGGGNVTVNGGTLGLSAGSVGNITVNAGGGLDLHRFGSSTTSNSGNVSFVPSAGITSTLHAGVTNFVGVVDRVNGTISLNNANLLLNTGGPFPAGSMMTILENDGPDPVTGTFLGLPEGAIINGGGVFGRISYMGLNGRSVTLTVVSDATAVPTTTTVTSSANPSTAGNNVAFTATVTSASGTPTGSVSFYDGSQLLDTSALISGTATLAVPLMPGAHTITAAYTGAGSFVTSQATLQQQVAGANIPLLTPIALTLLTIAIAAAGILAIRS